MLKKKIKHQGVHVEIAKSQKFQAKRAICKILASKVSEHMFGIELRFTSHIRYNAGSRQKQKWQNAMMKDKQVLANLVEFKLVNFEEKDLLIKTLDDKMMGNLITSLQSKSGIKTFAVIEWS